MNRRLKGFFKRSALSAIVLLWAVPLLPAAEDDADSTPIDRGEAYYHYTLGHLYHQLAGRFARSEYVDRAVKEYNAALEIDREADVIRNELIELYAGTNQLDKAVRVAEEIFERDPNNVEARKLLGAVYRRYAAGGRGRQVNPELIRKAIEQFEKVAEIEPGDIDNHLALGSLYRSAGEPEKAERALKRAIEIQPRHADAQVNLAYLQLESGNTEEAIAALESIVESAAVQNRHIGALAGAYEEAGRYRDAAEMYRKLVDAGGNQLQAMRRLAENLVYSRQYRAALDVYSQLTGLEPRNADHHLRISMIERERKNYAEAWASLDRAARWSRTPSRSNSAASICSNRKKSSPMRSWLSRRCSSRPQKTNTRPASAATAHCFWKNWACSTAVKTNSTKPKKRFDGSAKSMRGRNLGRCIKLSRPAGYPATSTAPKPKPAKPSKNIRKT